MAEIGTTEHLRELMARINYACNELKWRDDNNFELCDEITKAANDMLVNYALKGLEVNKAG